MTASHTRPTTAVLLALLTCLWAAPAHAQSPAPFLASAYCCNGVGGGYCGTTASGTRVGPGQIAADWRVLPRGSVWQVDGYGVSTVTDTGGDIKGNRIDVWFFSCTDAWAWGKRWVGLSPVSAVTPQPEWLEVVSETVYFDTDAWVKKTVFDSPRGLLTNYEVLRDQEAP